MKINHKKIAKWTVGITTISLSTYLYSQIANSNEWDDTEVTVNIEENTLQKNISLSQREQFLASLDWDLIPSPSQSTNSTFEYDTKSMRS